MNASDLMITVRVDRAEIIAHKGVVEQCEVCKSFCQPTYAIVLHVEIAHKLTELHPFRGCAICCRWVEARVLSEWPHVHFRTRSLYLQPDGSLFDSFAGYGDDQPSTTKRH